MFKETAFFHVSMSTIKNQSKSHANRGVLFRPPLIGLNEIQLKRPHSLRDIYSTLIFMKRNIKGGRTDGFSANLIKIYKLFQGSIYNVNPRKLKRSAVVCIQSPSFWGGILHWWNDVAQNYSALTSHIFFSNPDVIQKCIDRARTLSISNNVIQF